MKLNRTILTLAGACLALGSLSTNAREVVLHPRTTTTQWRSHLQNDPIEELHVWVRRASHNSDTYFNMRFGREGHTFDGRRVYLKGNRSVKASWFLNGRRPEGKELIMNSYNGSVHLERVVVVYRSGRQSERYYGRSNEGYYNNNRNERNDPYERRYNNYDRYEDRRQCDPGRYESRHYRDRWAYRR